MKYIENIREVAGIRPDYLGFIFYDKSKRNFEGIIPELPKNIKKTGVFVNEYIEIVVSLVEEYQLEAVQLHGDESVAYVQELRIYLPNIEIIKVFGIKDDFDFALLKPYEKEVDFFLFDTKGKERGGNGVTFNWDVLAKYNTAKPFFLSGGIGLDEVKAIKSLEKTKLPMYALDVNSRFETKAGFKSVEKLKEFKMQLNK
ncbi:phosphoribosylanthranilate isomerase [Tenacibaculum maritimum]|uniref:phosphoribosylanthranilate isomerase n=1 Tax=Tenacibaculum maritimum TaxID=107401 RepID=UPI001914F5C6|nr:phosphoribosylanthranilate isomerase [Tenacibaculum maritimum]